MTTEHKAKLFTERVQAAVEEIRSSLKIDPTEFTVTMQVKVETTHGIRIAKETEE